MSLLAASAMLLVLLGGAFTLGAGYGGGPRAVDAAPTPATAALPAAAPVVAAPAATSPPPASAGSAAVPITPLTTATATPVRVAVRLSCNDDANTLGLGLDLRTTEVIAAGVNRCAGWQLVQADTVVSWVPSSALPAGATASVTTAEATR